VSLGFLGNIGGICSPQPSIVDDMFVCFKNPIDCWVYSCRSVDIMHLKYKKIHIFAESEVFNEFWLF